MKRSDKEKVLTVITPFLVLSPHLADKIGAGWYIGIVCFISLSLLLWYSYGPIDPAGNHLVIKRTVQEKMISSITIFLMLLIVILTDRISLGWILGIVCSIVLLQQLLWYRCVPKNTAAHK